MVFKNISLGKILSAETLTNTLTSEFLLHLDACLYIYVHVIILHTCNVQWHLGDKQDCNKHII